MPSYNIKEIKEQFAEIIHKTQAIDKPKLDDLFTQWYARKLSFIENFNDNLIYKYPEKVNIVLSEEEKKANYTDFLYKINDSYYELSDFLELININDFYNNSFSEDLDYNGIHFLKGAKIIKAFKHFVDKDYLRAVQDAASMLIQQQKVTGYLYLSVHPIDYLTLSENNHNWHSCHSLTGDYCAGNLSYMADNSTVIAYVANDTKEFIPTIGTEWYSKKWRMLMHFSNDKTLVFAGRQYPFTANAIRDMIMEYQKTNIEYHWSKWHDNIIDRISFEKGKTPVILDDRYICLDRHLIPLRHIVKDVSYKEESDYVLHFNDILFSSTYTKPAWSILYKKGRWFDKELYNSSTDFSIGSEVKCLCCGKEYLTDSSRMVCERCDIKKRVYCDICNEAILPEEEIWLNDGSGVVCPYCYKNEISKCDKCGKETYKKNIYFDEKNERFICEECFAQEEEN